MVRVRVLIYQGSDPNVSDQPRQREWVATDRPAQTARFRLEVPFKGIYQQDVSRAALLRHTAARLFALADLDDAALTTGQLEERNAL